MIEQAILAELKRIATLLIKIDARLAQREREHPIPYILGDDDVLTRVPENARVVPLRSGFRVPGGVPEGGGTI